MSWHVSPLLHEHLSEATQLLKAACPQTRAHLVAEEKLFGTDESHASRVAVWQDSQLFGLAVTSDQWLRVLAVAPEHRNRGIGTTLLQSAEHSAASWGAKQLRTMDQPGNYLSPGVSDTDIETQKWLSRRGFSERNKNENLIIPIENNPRCSETEAHQLAQDLKKSGYEVNKATPAIAGELSDFITSNFSAGWAKESKNAIGRGSGAVFVAKHGEQIAGFAAHDGNNSGLGWFGPAGTAASHRGNGTGKALLVACMANMRKAGHPYATVAWIGPREFYRKSVGIDHSEYFTVFSKELST